MVVGLGGLGNTEDKGEDGKRVRMEREGVGSSLVPSGPELFVVFPVFP